MIIDHYIIREVIKPLFLISGALIVIFVGYSSGRYLSFAVEGLLQVDTLASYILIKVVVALEVLLPIALYLSIVLGLGRLESRLEVTALRSCGMSHARIMRVVVGIAVLLSVFVAAFSIFGRPIAYEKSYWIKARAEAELELDKLESATFYDSDQSQRTIFVERVDKATGEMEGVFIRGEKNGVVHVVSARAGIQHVDTKTGRRLLVLNDVSAYFIGTDGVNDKGIGKFGQMKLQLNDIAPVEVGYKRKAASIFELAESDSSLDVAEFQWRLSTPVSTVLLAMLGVVLSRAAPRASRYTKTIGALLIYAVYYNLTVMAKTWVETGVIGPVPGIWWVQAIFALLIIVLVYYPRWSFYRHARQASSVEHATTSV